MTVQRMDHVGVVVDDLEAAIAFFVGARSRRSPLPDGASRQNQMYGISGDAIKTEA
jgi:catechol 2,3-dioxygenase-like lactoylglutathione lyase family enzyme